MEEQMVEQRNDGRNEMQQAVYDKLTKTIKNVKGVPTEVPESTAANFLTVFREDTEFAGVKYNEMAHRLMTEDDDGIREWTAVDDATSRRYIEQFYRLTGQQKWQDALIEFQKDRAYQPIQEKINALKWDGKARVETFLIDWLKVEDTLYNREASRLLFAGGINRAYNAGCKFDCVLVRIGKQGCGKSTFCQKLAMDPRYYNSVKTMDCQKGYEAIQGMWVCELEEMMAVFSSKGSSQKEDKVKAFISTTDDYYRAPYTKRAAHNKRSCIFLGTTNRDTFLCDKTGARRWFPIRVKSEAKDLYDSEKEFSFAIEQAWAEMKAAFDNGEEFARPVPAQVMMDEICKEQESAEVEDYRVGLIEQYLVGKDKVCCLQVYKEAICHFEGSSARMTKADANDIAEILTNKLGWQRGCVTNFGPIYAKQKAFLRPSANGAA